VPYIGPKLSSLVDAISDVTSLFARELCDLGAEEMYDRAVPYTPVRSGAVRNAWTRTVVDRHGNVYEARVQNDHWRAHFAEWGTGPHRIEPEDQEAIETPEGRGRERCTPATAEPTCSAERRTRSRSCTRRWLRRS
jgi:Bacteriophage HK97-gp10, putative tail-component